MSCVQRHCATGLFHSTLTVFQDSISVLKKKKKTFLISDGCSVYSDGYSALENIDRSKSQTLLSVKCSVQ